MSTIQRRPIGGLPLSLSPCTQYTPDITLRLESHYLGRFTGLLGLIVLLAVAYALSTNRKAIRWRTVGWGLGLQLLFAFLVIKWTVGQQILATTSGFITSFLGHAADGSSMVFGALGDPKSPLNIFAFAVLPTIIFVSAFFAVLYHLGIMQWVIKGMAWLMQRSMGTSGAESMNVAASIFMGQTEAPLTIRPFLNGATQSELMTIMTSGMAHVSGGIMAAYISFGIHAQDLLSAVIMTAPGTILLSKMLVPETEIPATAGKVVMPETEPGQEKENLIGAIARGTIDGGQLAFNVAIMLISFLALVGLFNAIMLGISNFAWAHGNIPFPHSLNAVLGVVGAPVAWLIGIPLHEARIVGDLLGTRAILNEFIAYKNLGTLSAAHGISTRSLSIATFALCGFANVGSIGMQIGGIGALVPGRRNDLARLGLRAMLAGTMANLISAAIVSMLI